MGSRVGGRDGLPRDFGRVMEYRLVCGHGGSGDIASATALELERCARRAHGMIRAGGMRDPLSAFNEWSKLIFAKLYDERHTANGQPRKFQVGVGEGDVRVANRVRSLYDEARNSGPSSGPSIFTEEIILPDDKVMDVVGVLEDVGLTLSDVDALGSAFESFVGTVFREELGQYFTPRPLVRFTVAMVGPTEGDLILDPTAGTGGFLLEAILQVWRRIDNLYGGQPDVERVKCDFAHHNLYGIEINPVVGRVCQTNLLLHRDGHTNIEVGRTCLASGFTNQGISPDAPRFSVVLGNPPFGDDIRDGDTDRLGGNTLSAFEIGAGRNMVASELVVLERAVRFLVPGGRMGMVVPDGVLNNTSEQSRCVEFRRFLMRNARIDAVVSLPDHSFRRQGAQNKTSLLFCRRYTVEERGRFDRVYSDVAAALAALAAFEGSEGLGAAELDSAALLEAVKEVRYRVFFAEARSVGYTGAGELSSENDLYSPDGPDGRGVREADETTILGRYRWYRRNEDVAGTPVRGDGWAAEWIDEVFGAHGGHRLDPKFHMFHRSLAGSGPRAGLERYRLGDLLTRRRETVVPRDREDEEFVTLTLTQGGDLHRRRAGVGRNPPMWWGVYFQRGKWYRVREGDLLLSRIDLWKGCVSVVPRDYDGAGDMFALVQPIGSCGMGSSSLSSRWGRTSLMLRF